LLQDTLKIATLDLTLQGQADFILAMYGIFGDNSNGANTQVARLSNVAESYFNSNKLDYDWSNDDLKTLNCFGRVRETMK